jgi:hypothetical protein
MKSLAIILLTVFQVNSQGTPDTAAIIVNGDRYPFNEYDRFEEKVELYGCPGQSGSLFMPDYPLGLRLSSGVYLADRDRVLVCGGLRDTSGVDHTVRSECYSLGALDISWTQEADLHSATYSHFMTLASNIDDPAQV